MITTDNVINIYILGRCQWTRKQDSVIIRKCKPVTQILD